MIDKHKDYKTKDLSNKEIFTIISDEWKNLPFEQKVKYYYRTLKDINNFNNEEIDKWIFYSQNIDKKLKKCQQELHKLRENTIFPSYIPKDVVAMFPDPTMSYKSKKDGYKKSKLKKISKRKKLKI
jgi:hypothetical protein